MSLQLCGRQPKKKKEQAQSGRAAAEVQMSNGRKPKQQVERSGRWVNRGAPEPRLQALDAPRGSER